MTTYNRADLLQKRSLPSVHSQTYKNWECIVVDDCSNDNTPQVMEFFIKQDKRFQYLRLPENRGVSAAVNAAISLSKGDFIGILDSDDAYFPLFIEETLKNLERLPLDYGAVASAAIIIHPNGLKEKTTPKVDTFYTAVANGMWLFRSGVFQNDKLLFDENLSSDADADLGIRFFQNYKAKVINQPLMLKYGNPFGVSLSTNPSPRRLAELELFLDKHISLFKKIGTRKDLAWLYRFVGRNFLSGGNLKKGRAFLKLAFFNLPTPRNLFHFLAALSGHDFYGWYWQKELALARFFRSLI